MNIMALSNANILMSPTVLSGLRVTQYFYGMLLLYNSVFGRN